MRNKQVNLYRNVFHAEQQRRRWLLGVGLLGVLIVFPLIFVSYYIKGLQGVYQREIELIGQQAKAEKLLVEEVSERLQKSEIARRKDLSDEHLVQLKAQANILESKVGSNLISLLLSIEPVSSRLTTFGFKGSSIIFTGEAADKLAAIKLMDDLSSSLGTTEWVVKKKLVSKVGEKVIFELIVAGQLEGEQK